MNIDLSKFKKIINKVRELGFHNFHQAGSVSKWHELNLIIENPIQNRQYWITKSFGNFFITYRDGINNLKAEQYIIKCKNQKEVCERFNELITN